ncbi:MAG: TfpX/TfpZ family type IV pilin accessory protein [Burkholderiales bacterium]
MPTPAREAIDRPTPASSMAQRLRAAGIHLSLSALLAAAVLALVLLTWYPQPLPQLLGVGSILLIMLGVDVVLGPLFTLIVFDRRKKRLAWDLATIAALQLAALAYGLYTLHQGRPAYVVLVKDRFEIVSPADITPPDLVAAKDNPFAQSRIGGPRWVAVRMPDSASERQTIMMEALESGRDMQHHPRFYADYESQVGEAMTRSLQLSKLRSLNPSSSNDIDAAVAASGLSESALRYFPMRGPAADGAVLVSQADGRVLKVLPLKPW